MSSPVMPVPGVAVPTTAMPTVRTHAADSRDFAAELDAVERGFAIDAHTKAPPEHLLDEIAAAAALHDRLAAEGVHVSFSTDPGSPGHATLSDAEGSSTSLTAAAASEIACGRLPG